MEACVCVCVHVYIYIHIYTKAFHVTSVYTYIYVYLCVCMQAFTVRSPQSAQHGPPLPAPPRAPRGAGRRPRPRAGHPRPAVVSNGKSMAGLVMRGVGTITCMCVYVYISMYIYICECISRWLKKVCMVQIHRAPHGYFARLRSLFGTLCTLRQEKCRRCSHSVDMRALQQKERVC